MRQKAGKQKAQYKQASLRICLNPQTQASMTVMSMTARVMIIQGAYLLQFPHHIIHLRPELGFWIQAMEGDWLPF